MSKRHELAEMCREKRDDAMQARAANDYSPKNSQLGQCAMLLGVLALLLDDEAAPPPNGVPLYRREGRAFVKVK